MKENTFYVGVDEGNPVSKIISNDDSSREVIAGMVSKWIVDGLNVRLVSQKELLKLLRAGQKADATDAGDGEGTSEQTATVVATTNATDAF